MLATPFNESAMSFVWTESLRQSQSLIESWTKGNNKEGFSSTAKDTRTLSLNVMAACGFRRSFDFQGSSEEVSEKGTYSYRDALQIVLDSAILLMLIPYQYLQYSWLPQKLRILGKAAADFKLHMTQMLEEEAKMMDRGEKGSGSLMTSLVRALDTRQKEDTSSAGMKGLSVDEIFGNIFVINFAGHDTTANTLAFSMLLLAAYPDVQDWVSEEVREVTKGLEIADWGYNALFPHLKRCRAILVRPVLLDNAPLLNNCYSMKRSGFTRQSCHYPNGQVNNPNVCKSAIVLLSFLLSLESVRVSSRHTHIPNTGQSRSLGSLHGGSWPGPIHLTWLQRPF